MRTIFFSNQFALSEGHGIRRYSLELVRALQGLEQLTLTPMAGWTDRRDLEAFSKETGLQLTGLGRNGTKLAWTFLNRPYIETRIAGDVDLVHAGSLGYPIATRKPFVVTIHDLGPLTRPDFFRNTKPWVMERSLRQAVARADQIICVSQSTADEVCNYVGANIESRIAVVHEAVDPVFRAHEDTVDLSGLTLPPPGVPFVLSAGKISPRKNVQGVLAAVAALSDKIDHHLVLVGGNGWDLQQALFELNDPRLMGRVHMTGFVSEAQLRELYRQASLYVHASLYEGFGLTILEAMASGTPVITSNCSSLPEVSGGAALMVDPASVEQIADGILAVCSQPDLSDELVRRGRARVNEFSWSKAANETHRIYRNAVS